MSAAVQSVTGRLFGRIILETELSVVIKDTKKLEHSIEFTWVRLPGAFGSKSTAANSIDPGESPFHITTQPLAADRLRAALQYYSE